MVTVLIFANTRDVPFCHTRTVPERSAQNSLPSGAKASAVAKLAGMVPPGSGSLDGATHGLAVGDGVALTCAVGVACDVTLGVDRGVEPQAAASTTRPASAARRRIPMERSADREARLLVSLAGGDIEMFAPPGIDGVDHALQVDARRSELVRRPRRHL